MCRALTGAASPQTESISVSTDTASPMCRRRVPSSARSRRLGRSMGRPSTSASSRPSIRNVTCVTQTRIPQPRAGFQRPIERRWSTCGAARSHRDCRCVRFHSSSEWQSLRLRWWRRRDMHRPPPRQPPTPAASGASAPARCSSIIRTTWARAPTRSRWPATSEPPPLNASSASALFPPRSNFDESAASGSRRSAGSRRAMRETGSASTTPSRPPSRRRRTPLSQAGSTDWCTHPTDCGLLPGALSSRSTSQTAQAAAELWSHQDAMVACCRPYRLKEER